MKHSFRSRFGALCGLLLVTAGVLAVVAFPRPTPSKSVNKAERKPMQTIQAYALTADAGADAIEAAHEESERILRDVIRPGIRDLRPNQGEIWTADKVQAAVSLIRMRNSSLESERDVILQNREGDQYADRLESIEKHISDNLQTIVRFEVVTAARAESDRVLREEVTPGIEALRPQAGEKWTSENALAAADLVRRRNASLEDERAAINQNGYADSHDDRLNRIGQIIAQNEDAIRRFEEIARQAAEEKEREASSSSSSSTDGQNTSEPTVGAVPETPGGDAAGANSSDASGADGAQASSASSQSQQTLSEEGCGRVLKYHFASIDPRFGMSEADARGLFAMAEAVWEGPTGKNLFQEQAGSSLPVRFVYGQNQEDYNLLESMRVDIDADQADYTAAVQLYRDLMEQHRADPSNQDIVDRVNALVDHIRRVGPLLNAKIDNFNRIGRQRGRMTLGYYFRTVGGAEGIDILVMQSNATKRIRLVAHEIGHALGLDHVRDANALMYELNSGDDNVLRQDDTDELDKVCRRREAGRAVHNGAEREEAKGGL